MAVDTRSSYVAQRRLSEQIRQAALNEIEARSLGEEDLAEALGLSQTAVYLLSLKESWPLAVSVQIADALGLHVDVTISENGGATPPEARAA